MDPETETLLKAALESSRRPLVISDLLFWFAVSMRDIYRRDDSMPVDEVVERVQCATELLLLLIGQARADVDGSTTGRSDRELVRALEERGKSGRCTQLLDEAVGYALSRHKRALSMDLASSAHP
jgi:hypothetical protein